jgi:adenylosuccinate lyase
LADEYKRKQEEYKLLDDKQKSTTEPPEKPTLWTAADVAKNKELMNIYRSASDEDKAIWREFAEKSRAPENNKKESTEANHDVAAVNRSLTKAVSYHLQCSHSRLTEEELG